MFVFTDVISIEKTGEHFRLIYDVKGRFTVHRITAEEAKVRDALCLQMLEFTCLCMKNVTVGVSLCV